MVAGEVQPGQDECGLDLRDAAGAEACYRQALAKDDTLRVSSPAANNLAMVLGNKGEKLDEAVAWAKKAVAAASVAPYYDTLAFVLNKNRQTDEAQQAIGRAIELDPANPEWKINAAEMLLAAGKRSQAQEMFGRVDLLQPDASGHLAFVGVVYIVFKAVVAIGLWGAAAVGFLRTPIGAFERAFAFAAASLLVAAAPWTDQVGFAMSAVVVIWHIVRSRRATAPAAAA